MPDVVSDSAFPDRIGVVDGPMMPCKVVEIVATTAPTTTEGPRAADGLKLLEQVQQYRIRYKTPARLNELTSDPGLLFGRLPVVVVGQELSAVHAVVLDAYRRARGLPPWLRRAPGSSYVSTACEVNEAVHWWNTWQDGGAA